jgi:hypothetical protein
MTKEELYGKISGYKIDLISTDEVDLDSIANNVLTSLRELQEHYNDKFKRTISNSINDVKYQIEKEFDIYRERRGRARDKSYQKEKAKLKESLEKVLSPLRHEIQGHGEID